MKAGPIVLLCVILFYSDRYISEGSSSGIVGAGTNRSPFLSWHPCFVTRSVDLL